MKKKCTEMKRQQMAVRKSAGKKFIKVVGTEDDFFVSLIWNDDPQAK